MLSLRVFHLNAWRFLDQAVARNGLVSAGFFSGLSASLSVFCSQAPADTCSLSTFFAPASPR